MSAGVALGGGEASGPESVAKYADDNFRKRITRQSLKSILIIHSVKNRPLFGDDSGN